MDNNNKNKKIYLIIIIIVILLSVLLFILLGNNNSHQNNNSDNNSKIQYQTNTFKGFDLKIPTTVTYNTVSYDDNKFKLTTDAYEALIQIYKYNDEEILLHMDEYYEKLRKNNYDVEKPYKITSGTSNEKMVVYNKNDANNSLLCYFLYSDLYLIEIELYNTDNTFRLDFLDSLVDIMMNSKLNEDKNKNYTYSTINFSEY